MLKLIVPAAAAVVALLAPGVARADAVTDWNAHATTAIVTNAGQVSHASTISFAKVHGAVFDAVNGIDRGYTRYLALPRANPWDSKDAAVATAAYRVLLGLFPGQQSFLDPLYQASLAAIPDGPMKQGGIAAGEVAAATMLAARTDDGFNGPPAFVIGTGPGEWRPTPPGFGLEPASWTGDVSTFLIPRNDLYRSEGPNSLTSNAYEREFAEVKKLGSATSTKRTADETDAAFFWQDQVPRMWNRAIRRLSADRGLGIVDNARLFAMVNLASADGAISCWNDKYYWNFWRPVTAIREAATDGNPDTEADPTWTPLFPTPAFPEHPSGHGCVSGAFVYTLESFFGTDSVAITVESNAVTAVKKERSFERLSDARKEIIDCRVWGGIHFRTADVQGTVIGRRVVRWMDRHFFKPATDD
jgi:PAP2 superfamily